MHSTLSRCDSFLGLVTALFPLSQLPWRHLPLREGVVAFYFRSRPGGPSRAVRNRVQGLKKSRPVVTTEPHCQPWGGAQTLRNSARGALACWNWVEKGEEIRQPGASRALGSTVRPLCTEGLRVPRERQVAEVACPSPQHSSRRHFGFHHSARE